ncbi:hypothetical protein TcG_12116 [Trypanosoma cruzi]|nr:hypothetical protein TcG_12116 [Trypanosoma cruzi]
MVFSGNASCCVLGTHPHTLSCFSVGVIAAAAWSTAAAVGVLERDEAPRNKRVDLLDEIKMAVESCFVAFAPFIAKNAAFCRLTGCLHSAHFEALRSFIQGYVTIIMATPSSTALSVTIRMTAKRAMRMMMVCTEGRIICVSLYTNPRKVWMSSPQFPTLRNRWLSRCHPPSLVPHAFRLIHLPWSSRSSSRVVMPLIPRWPFCMYLSVAWRMI